jgi:hypothetical protein
MMQLRGAQKAHLGVAEQELVDYSTQGYKSKPWDSYSCILVQS